MNCTIKTYLKIYSNTKQDNWVSLLPIAQIAYNNKQSEATGQTPYFANYRRNPNLFQQTFSSPKAKAAIKLVEEIKAIYKDMSEQTLHA
jgi:hypothetical protein